jgi:hypothetical protein
MTTIRNLLAAAVLITAGCGAEPAQVDEGGSSLSAAAAQGAVDQAAPFIGTYSGRLTSSLGQAVTVTAVSVTVEAASAGFVKVPLRDISPPPEDHVEFPPPSALAIVLARPGDWPYRLATGERYRLDSVNLRFAEDGSSLEVTSHATLEGGGPMTWSFVGKR